MFLPVFSEEKCSQFGLPPNKRREKWREKMAQKNGAKKWREISKVLAGKLNFSFLVGGKFILIFRLET